jgi:hypothetical protein
MSGFKRPLMPSADDLDPALVTSTGKITRQSKPCSLLLRQRNHRGLGGYATLVDLGAPELLRGAQHIPGLAAFRKSTVSGLIPISGLGGIQTNWLIREVMELEALPAKPKGKAA